MFSEIQIPAELLGRDDLTPTSLIIYGCLCSLTEEDGYCDIDNQYIADMLHLARNTVSRTITRLERAGLVKRKIVYKRGAIIGRKLSIKNKKPKYST